MQAPHCSYVHMYDTSRKLVGNWAGEERTERYLHVGGLCTIELFVISKYVALLLWQYGGNYVYHSDSGPRRNKDCTGL